MKITGIFVSAAALVAFAGGGLAADLPSASGPPVFTPPPSPVFSWAGLYVGAQVGYQGGATRAFFATDPGNAYLGPETPFNQQGVVAGLHLGYNWQMSQFVFGLEGDIEGSSFSGEKVDFAAYSFTDTLRTPVEGSIRGRVGYTVDRALFYATGGSAFESNRYTVVDPYGADSATTGRVGWTAGVGVEYAIDPHWSVRAEYRYTNYGTISFPFTNLAPGYELRQQETDSRVEGGVSYKFDLMSLSGPVVAKY